MNATSSSTATTGTLTPILTRRAVPWPHRQPAFIEHWQDFALSDLLMQCLGHGVRTLYLVGGDKAATTPSRDYWYEPVQEGWELSGYTTWPHSAKYSITNELQARPCKVDVHMSAAWFGPLASAYDCCEAYDALKAALRQYFGPTATCMGTPGRTGLDLFQRVLPHSGHYAVPPADVCDILHRNIGQGRMHPSPEAAAGTTADALFWLDARWMYAHCLRNLPTGEAHYNGDWLNSRAQTIDPYAPAFYCVSFRVPLSWPHDFGLLPSRETGEDGDAHTVWPHTPGEPGVGWCTGAELQLAREQGWHATIHEGIEFWGGQPDPARPWIDRLRALRSQTTNPHIYAAARELVIHAIGGWGRQARSELRSVPRSQKGSIPASAYDVTLAGDRIDYRVDVPLDTALSVFMHPEWACMVWGRSRAHLARAALQYLRDCPRGRILWWRNDALVVDQAPGWTDDGLVGTFRLKRSTLGGGSPVDVPRTETEYRALLARMEG